jgi:hypothetical protein
MTEDEWLKSNDPVLMLNSLGVDEDWVRRGWLRRKFRTPPAISKRKLFLFVSGIVAAFEACEDRADQRSRWQRLTAALEMRADGQARASNVELARSAVEWEKDNPSWGERLIGASEWDFGPPSLHCPFAAALSYADSCNPERGSKTLHELIGNPFRTITVDRSWLTWHDATVRKLAQGIYADRDFDHLPILADALEDAGCDNADILAHCRGPGPHVRGCWVVDLILGKP